MKDKKTTQITKKTAIRLLAEGKTVGACPSKMNPQACGRAFLVELHKDQQHNCKINDYWCSTFRWYNCDKERGNGIAWYLVEEVDNVEASQA